MPPEFTPQNLYGWPGLVANLGPLSIGLAPDIGGRIISLTYEGKELLFVQKEHAGETFDFSQVSDLDAEKRRLGFRLWGGDKTWVAPQEAWTEAMPPLELDAGRYSCTHEGLQAVMTSPVCHETGLRISREVCLADDGTIELCQTFHNATDTPVTRGIWDVTQALRPFDVYFPCKKEDLRPYPQEGDSVVLADQLLEEVEGWTRLPCREAAHFKFGARLDKGMLIALRPVKNGMLIFGRRFRVDPEGHYLHGANAEVYNSPNMNYLEIEVHGPSRTLSPGEKLQHIQKWKIGRSPRILTPTEAADLLFEA